MPATLYRVEEITDPGTLPAGRYLFTRQKRIIVEIELHGPTHPRNLKAMVRSVLTA